METPLSTAPSFTLLKNLVESRTFSDYLIKYAYFVKCCFNQFASISDPEKWTKNVAQRKKKKNTWNVIWNNSWLLICFVNDVTKHVFLNGEGLQTLILGIFTTEMLHKQYKS